MRLASAGSDFLCPQTGRVFANNVQINRKTVEADCLQVPLRYNMLMFWYQNDWGVLGRRNEMLARSLARHPRVSQVLHVEPPLNVVGLLRRFAWTVRSPDPGTLQMFFKTIQRLFRRPASEGGKLKLLTPFAPVPQREFTEGVAFKWNWTWYSRGLRRRFLSKGEGQPILWLYPPHPVADHLTSMLPEVPVVLDCVEMVTEDGGLASEKRARRLQSYERLSRRATVIFAVSEELRQALARWNENTVHLPNAIDPPLLSRSADSAPRRDVRRSRVGYVGTIYDRLDLDLIREMARQRPEWHFTFVGGTRHSFRREWSKLQEECPNVRRLSMRSYSSLPEVLAQFDVCIIPHGISNLTNSMDPQKLYTYLAAGKPVVSTPVAISEELRPYVRIAVGVDEFLRQIELAVETDSFSLQRRRVEGIRFQSWEKRVDKVLSVLDANLERAHDVIEKRAGNRRSRIYRFASSR